MVLVNQKRSESIFTGRQGSVNHNDMPPFYEVSAGLSTCIECLLSQKASMAADHVRHAAVQGKQKSMSLKICRGRLSLDLLSPANLGITT